MKKVTALILVFCMIISVLPVLAAESIAEDVLLSVKSRVDIPEELTEFEYSESTYDNVLRYDFSWRDEDYNKEVYVTSDSLGRIVSYNYYEATDYSADRSLINYTLSDAQPLAEAFVKKAFPEYFENEIDILKLNESRTTSSYTGRYKTFAFSFERLYNGEIMASNIVNVRVRATKDKIYVQNVSAALDEDATFVQKDAIAIGENDYTVRFPIELYYATDYSGEEEKVTLFYSIDKGFVSRIDTVVLTEKRFDRYADYGAEDDAVMESTSTAGGVNKNMAALTPEEIKALEEMASLVPISEVEAKLRGIEILHITDDMKLADSNARKYDEKYNVNFSLEGENQRTSVSYDGETGEVTNIYTYFTKYDEAYNKTSDSMSVLPTASIESFAREMAGEKLDETKIEYTDNGETQKRSGMNATRIVNGIPYPENSIDVTYDMANNMVTRYSIYWDEDVTGFPKPEAAIGLDKAAEIIFDISPVYNTLVKTEEGYTPAITIPEAVTIYALTGENRYSYAEEKQAYTDIESHWAKKEIEVLWEHNIYLTGDKFNPDEAITQADMLRLFTACRDSGVIPIGWEKAYVSEFAVGAGYIESSEPDKLMTRKEAFEALVNVLGYGDIAGYDIYKSSYTDMEANGSAEILKAMGILVGDTARPDDNLTRAEAAVMVYRYLSK